MMKVFFLTSFLFTISLIHAQTSFEGYVVYKIEPQNPNKQLIADSIFYQRIKKVMNGQLYSIQKYFYKGDTYKSEVGVETKKTYQVFKPKEKRLYTWQQGVDSTIWVNSEKYSDKIKEVKQLPEEDVVLGIKCKKIVVISNIGETTYWYNPNKYKISYDAFKTHTYGNWNEYLKIAGALPIKFEVKGKMFYIITTATEVKEVKVKDSEFDLPTFKKVIQSPTN
jgi:hypothetical protein